MGLVKNTLVAMCMLYASSFSQKTVENWKVSSSAFLNLVGVDDSSKATLEYDAFSGNFRGDVEIKFSGLARLKYDRLGIKVISDDTSYLEDTPEWKWSYRVKKRKDTLDVTSVKYLDSSSYFLVKDSIKNGLDLMDPGAAFLEILNFIEVEIADSSLDTSQSIIGDKMSYNIHSNGKLVGVVASFEKSNINQYDFCVKLRTISGEKLFGLVKDIDVYFKNKYPDYVSASLGRWYTINLEGKLISRYINGVCVQNTKKEELYEKTIVDRPDSSKR
ncbi:MAG: hypothetical protein WC755_05885 [Candidatus Woesearchaeota archaeon]|jgi:hypothetical protein